APTVKRMSGFVIGGHVAGRPGIQHPPADVKALVSQATRNRLTGAESERIQRELRKTYGHYSPELLVTALADEFRVRLAQDALLGTEVQSYDRLSPTVTPYEFWKFYREQRAENTVVLLPISVHHPEFLNKAGSPSE